MDFNDIRKFGAYITRLINKQNITRNEAKEMFSQVLLNKQPELQQGAFLAALIAKGETSEEIAGSWEAIFDLDTVKVTPEVIGGVVENSGTGMDSIKTFNISTAASIVAASADIPIARHGSRAITSTCGTIDILEELGVDVECNTEVIKNSIEKVGIGIFNGMSPQVHPKALGRILTQIAFGTTLNIAASLANPASPRYAVRGVYSKQLVEPVAFVMKEIGFKKALVIHGLDESGKQGMDEASTIGETCVAELSENGEVKKYSFTPEDIGISRPDKKLLSPSSDRKQEAKRLVSLLEGSENNARSDIVSLNAGLILYLMGKSKNFKEGYYLAKEMIVAGKPIDKLKHWVRVQNSNPEKGIKRLNGFLQAI